MAKGLNRGNKEAKKPKKDKSVAKEVNLASGGSRFPTPQKDTSKSK